MAKGTGMQGGQEGSALLSYYGNVTPHQGRLHLAFSLPTQASSAYNISMLRGLKEEITEDFTHILSMICFYPCEA